MTFRAIGIASGAVAEAETNTASFRVSERSPDWTILGSYQQGWSVTTDVTAGQSANAVYFSWLYAGPSVAALRRVTLNMFSNATGFTAGVASFFLFAERSANSLNSTGEAAAGSLLAPTVGSNDIKLSTLMAPTIFNQAAVVSTGAANQPVGRFAKVSGNSKPLSAWVVAEDANPLAAVTFAVTTATMTPFLQECSLWDVRAGEWPLIVKSMEGILIRGTVPATGVWRMNGRIAWDELETY